MRTTKQMLSRTDRTVALVAASVGALGAVLLGIAVYAMVGARDLPFNPDPPIPMNLTELRWMYNSAASPHYFGYYVSVTGSIAGEEPFFAEGKQVVYEERLIVQNMLVEALLPNGAYRRIGASNKVVARSIRSGPFVLTSGRDNVDVMIRRHTLDAAPIVSNVTHVKYRPGLDVRYLGLRYTAPQKPRFVIDQQRFTIMGYELVSKIIPDQTEATVVGWASEVDGHLSIVRPPNTNRMFCVIPEHHGAMDPAKKHGKRDVVVFGTMLFLAALTCMGASVSVLHLLHEEDDDTP